MYDCHTHTNVSHDSVEEPRKSILSAIEKGLGGIAFTNHCDAERSGETDVVTPIIESITEISELKHTFAGEIKVFMGVELGGAAKYHTIAEKLFEHGKFDIVIGSVHEIDYPGYAVPYSKIKFSEFSKNQIIEYLTLYFNYVLYMVESTDFDVLAHLTCPLRYIVKKYGIKVDLTMFYELIIEILCEVIRKDIALEINTSECSEKEEFFMPDLEIVQCYWQLGGRKITIGSDAHKAIDVGNCFDILKSKLKVININKLCFYENREAVLYEI